MRPHVTLLALVHLPPCHHHGGALTLGVRREHGIDCALSASTTGQSLGRLLVNDCGQSGVHIYGLRHVGGDHSLHEAYRALRVRRVLRLDMQVALTFWAQ